MTHRSLHLIDIENLLGAGSFERADAMRAASSYWAVADRGPNDLAVAASSHRSGVATAEAFPAASVRWRSGPDGADQALLDAADELPLTSFGRLVIGSGDRIFTNLARRAVQSGLTVELIARPESTARELGAVADIVHPFPALAGCCV